MVRRWRWLTRGALVLTMMVVIAIVAGNVWVLSRATGAIVSARDARPARAAVVFGAGVRPDGTVSDVLADRRGMIAQGVPADRRPYRGIAWFHAREIASRVKALVDVALDRPPRGD